MPSPMYISVHVQDRDDAAAICEQLDVPFHEVLAERRVCVCVHARHDMYIYIMYNEVMRETWKMCVVSSSFMTCHVQHMLSKLGGSS